MKALDRALLGALMGGVGGWMLESAVRGHLQWSPMFDRAPIPFIPTYALGGALLGLIEPVIEPQPLLVRGAAYAGVLTAVEYAACQVDRAAGNRTWGYGQDGKACIDIPHTIAWGILGLAGEQVIKALK